MPANSLPKRFYRKYHKAFLFIILVTTFFSVIYLSISFFQIKNIVIDNQSTSPILGLDEIKATNFIWLKEKDLEERLRNLNPYINVIKIEKKFPNIVKIVIVEYKTITAIQGNTKYLLLSIDGRILQKTDNLPQNIPLINYYQKINEQFFNVGDRLVYKDILIALYYQKSLDDLGLIIDSIDISGFDMIVFKVGGHEFVFSSNIDKEKTMFAVEKIIKNFRIEGKDYKKIDLRFDKPVVTF